MKNTIIAVLIVVLVGLGVYFIVKNTSSAPVVQAPTYTTPANDQPAATTTLVEASEVVIGKSVEGRDIVAYNFGKGDTRILLVGGIHGGYSWNTAQLAYQMMDYLKANAWVIPANIKITIIPTLNPDGLSKAVATTTNGRFVISDVSKSQTTLVASRFNFNNVDLSRNFDCNWKSVGVWQTKSVSGGASPFSEPESLAIKSYVEKYKVAAAVVYYSSAGGVYSSECGSGVLSETVAITNIYAKASGYPAFDSYDFYETSGDMVNWLAKVKIPAISVLLTTHDDTELAKNQKGLVSLIQHYTK